MFYHKTGNPEVSELVVSTVTKILPHAVFCQMDEYGKSGMIHISEIAPGRIRNMNEFVSEGKKTVCKVLRVDLERGHIDLSLRRVNEGQRRDKMEQIKKEQKAEKVIEILAIQLKMKAEELYATITKPVFLDYEYLHQFFEDVVNKEATIEELKLAPQLSAALRDLVHQRMAPSEIEIKGVIAVQTYDAQGVQLIRELFKKMKDSSISFKYLGSGKYATVLRGYDYEQLETVIRQKIEPSLAAFSDKMGEAKFIRS